MHALVFMLLAVLLTPQVSFAQVANFYYFYSLASSVRLLIEQVVPLLVAIALLVFIWGLVQFILISGEEGAKEIGKRRMVGGILALFVIVSVWGLVDLLAEISGISTVANVVTPTLPF